MKREVEREQRLPAFWLERGDVELLWQRLNSLFDQADPVIARLSLSLPNERLTFDSIEELNSYPIRGTVTDFNLELRQGKRSVLLKSGGIVSKIPTIKVASESDIWCAGALEAALQVINTRRAWYAWLSRLPYLPVAMFVCMLPFLKVGPFKDFPSVSIWVMASWLASAFFLTYLATFREKIIPNASIVFTRELGFFRRYSGEIGLVLGIASIILSIYMWMRPFPG